MRERNHSPSPLNTRGDHCVGTPMPLADKPHGLDAKTRASFEPLFGHDFANVRIYSEEEGDQRARDESAWAVAEGQNLFFRRGAYNPDTDAGRTVLAHELAHVVQQSHGVRAGTRGSSNDVFEREAHRAAHAATRGQAVEVTRLGNAPGVQHLRTDEMIGGVGDASASTEAGGHSHPQPAAGAPVAPLMSDATLNRTSNIRNAASGLSTLGVNAARDVVESVPNEVRMSRPSAPPTHTPGTLVSPVVRNPAVDAARAQVRNAENALSIRGRAGQAMAAADAVMTYESGRRNGQGVGEASVGAVASAGSNVLYSASPVDVAINVANYGAQAMGAPQGVQDATGVVASATPSSFIQSLATHGGRAVANTASALTGDTSGFRRQGQDIVSGAGGAYPLQGYGLITQAVAAAVQGQDLDVALNHLITPAAASNTQGNTAARGPVVAAGNGVADAYAEAQRGVRANTYRGVDQQVALERAEAERNRRFQAEQMDGIIANAMRHNNRDF